MKRKNIWKSLIICLSLAVVAQAQMIENPGKAKAPNAGRVIIPKLVLSIADDGNLFYFKSPYRLKIGPDGSIVVTDNEQILHFDKDGRFIRNYFKKGQGPGEISQVDNYAFLDAGSFLVHSVNPSKMIWFDAQGNLEKEVSLPPEYKWVNLLGNFGNNWIFATYSSPHPKDGAAYSEIPYQLIVWNEQTSEWATSERFDCTFFVASNGGSTSEIGITSILAAFLDQGLVAISHTQEYLIKILQILPPKIIREFRRPYPRVPPPPLKPGQKPFPLNVNGKEYEMPARNFVNDIASIQAISGRIWVITSTIDKKKGLLIDDFDTKGIYQDSFYLNLPEGALARPGSIRFNTDGTALFTIETNEDGTKAIKKYALK